ncbi:MAG TPA: hypothetical protein VD999_03595 [Vitreimonas sp.]|nr:hypothetical protein [Vitreimonas sp.]
MKKNSLLIGIVLVLIAGVLASSFFIGQNLTRLYPTPSSSPSPTPLPTLETADQIKAVMAEGAQLREAGNYTESEPKLKTAFYSAVTIKDQALAIETGNNLSILFRLQAGRASRQKQPTQAQAYSDSSLAVYETLKANNWFNDQDPGLARNWAHALLYAGKVEPAITALQHSQKIQTAPAAQGDEMTHLGAAYLAQGKMTEAQPLITQGLALIEKNNGSKIWLTFGLMSKAQLLAQTGQLDEAKKALVQAQTIANENNLVVRREEIEYLLAQPPEHINVLQTVGVLPE